MIEPEESLRMRPLAQAARSSRSPHRRLDLDAIERSLRGLQHEFERINETLTVPRDPLSDCVLENMMLGYRRVDRILADRIDLFALGSSGYLLELNALVLWGDDHRQREASRAALDAARRRFYSDGQGGVGALSDWLGLISGQSIWRRAASVYLHMLSQPQLFQEGNHRTGALVMSWILASEGQPPFVLSVNNARGYFEPSTLAKEARRNSLRMLLVQRPRLVRRFAALLRQDADPAYLLA
jgi:hypothetical protein